MSTDAKLYLVFPPTLSDTGDRQTTGEIALQLTAPTTGKIMLNNLSPAQGDVLTIINTLADANGITSIEWSWYENGELMPGETGQSIVAATIGSVYYGYARVIDGIKNITEFRTLATAPVIAVVIPEDTTGSISLDNMSPQKNDILTIQTSLSNANGIASIEWSWYENGSLVIDENQQVLSASMLGATYRGHASVTDNLGGVTEFDTLTTAAVAAAGSPTAGGITLDNLSPVDGNTISVISTINDDDEIKSIVLMWYINGNTSTADTESIVAIVGNTYRMNATVTDNLGNVTVFNSPTTSETTTVQPDHIRNGIRQYGAIGVTNISNKRFHQQLPGEVTQRYNTYLAGINSGNFGNNVYPTIRMRFHWYTFYKDDGATKPSIANAQNKNWSNFRWNDAGGNPNATNGSGYLYDPVSEALASNFVNHGNGIGKIQIDLNLTATGGSFNPPLWMRKEPYGWHDDSGGANDVAGLWHINYQNAEVKAHVIAFLTAVMDKYGRDEGVHSIQMDEYYLNAQPWASGVTRDAYYNAAASVWAPIAAAAPVDANGNRVNLIQSGAILSTPELSLQTIQNAGFGVATSDASLGFEPNYPAVLVSLRDLGLDEFTHIQCNNDGRFASKSRVQSWNGVGDNPFGHTSAYSGVATPHELFWYYGKTGGCPVDSFFMNIEPGTVQNLSAFQSAANTYGQDGTAAGQWLPTPRILSNTSNFLGGAYAEAEEYATGSVWQVESTDGAINGQNAVNTAPFNGDAGAVDSINVGRLVVNFTGLFANNQYHVWLRARVDDNSQNSCYIYNGSAYELVYFTASLNNWLWDDSGITLTADENGNLTVSVKNRETGLRIDRIYITSDPNGTPT